jgi:hypothetical protein
MSDVYTYFKDEYSRGTFVWDVSDNIKVILITTGYIFDPDHHYVSELSQYEINGTNYISGYGNAGRALIESRSVYTDLSTDSVYFKGDNISWSGVNAGIIGSLIIAMESGGSDSNSLLIAHLTSGGLPLTTDGTSVNLVWNTLGIFKV